MKILDFFVYNDLAYLLNLKSIYVKENGIEISIIGKYLKYNSSYDAIQGLTNLCKRDNEFINICIQNGILNYVTEQNIDFANIIPVYLMRKSMEINGEDTSVLDFLLSKGLFPDCVFNSNTISSFVLQQFMIDESAVYEQIVKNIFESSNIMDIPLPNLKEIYLLWKNHNIRNGNISLQEITKLLKNKSHFDSLEFNLSKFIIENINSPSFKKLVSLSDDELEEFCKSFHLLKQNLIHKKHSDVCVDLLKFVNTYQKHTVLFNNIQNNYELMTAEHMSGLKFLLESNSTISVSSIDELLTVKERIIEDLRTTISGINNINDVRKLLSNFILDMDTSVAIEYMQKIIHINYLENIKNNAKSSELFEKASALYEYSKITGILLTGIYDIDYLKEALDTLIVKNPDLFTKYVQYMSELSLHVTEVYELEAQENLTDLDSLAFEQREGYKYIDLSDKGYTMYVTVTPVNNLQELETFVDSGIIGRTTICVSVETNFHTDYYDTGLTLGYTQIPNGSFVVASPKNFGSNNYISTNQSEIEGYFGMYVSNTPIRESRESNNSEHSETILYRKNLKPSCIICRGNEPSDLEIEAAILLQIPIVKLQAPRNISLSDVVEETKEIIDINYESEMSDFIRNLDYDKIREAFLLKEISIGNSHTMYEGVLRDDNKRYYFKPAMTRAGTTDLYRAHAMKAASIIQKMVYKNSEVDSSVSVKLARTDERGTDMLYSAIEVIPDIVDLSKIPGIRYNPSQVETLIREMIVDHLVFNYDTKPENFVITSNGRIYGIDKEQSLKDVIDSHFVNEKTGEFKTDIDLTFSPNGNALFYFDLIQQYQIPRKTVESLRSICRMIQTMPNRDYLHIFKGYIDEFINANPNKNRNLIEQSILARKNDLVNAYEKIVSTFNIDETIVDNEIEIIGDIVSSDDAGLREGSSIYGIKNELLILSNMLTNKNIDSGSVNTTIATNISGDFVDDFKRNSTAITGPLYVIRDNLSNEISSIVISQAEDNTDPTKIPKLIQRVINDVVRNGKYIPVVEKTTGEILLTEEKYREIRKKMDGLISYGIDTYSISDSLYHPNPEIEKYIELVDLNAAETKKKEEAVLSTLGKALERLDLKLETNMSSSDTSVLHVISTGSTGRNTNLPGDGDFDFIVRVDKSILHDYEKFDLLKKSILESLGKIDSSGEFLKSKDDKIDGLKIRLNEIKIEGVEQELKIDISFTEKTEEIIYATEKAVEERLQTIRNQSEDEYKRVVANILYAKEFLKHHHVYKRKQSDRTQGGLGGVGVENWILQNGGSFEEAVRSFLEIANKSRNMIEFESKYEIWDYGKNHFSVEKQRYPYDDYIYNMNPTGYENMKKALNEWIQSIEKIEKN